MEKSQNYLKDNFNFAGTFRINYDLLAKVIEAKRNIGDNSKHVFNYHEKTKTDFGAANPEHDKKIGS
jgi:hypothetical protein